MLYDLSFHVKSGERIGIGKSVSCVHDIGELTSNLLFTVGRTGSGKVYNSAFCDKCIHMINTELTHTFTLALYLDGRKCLLRWHSNQQNQSRCLKVEYYHHSTNGTPMFRLIKIIQTCMYLTNTC